MACSKYTLTNTGTTAINFNYRRCDDSLWEYQVNLDPNETKNIWLINGTYNTAPNFDSSISLVNNGTYPLTPTPTPSVTATPTGTPSCDNPGCYLYAVATITASTTVEGSICVGGLVIPFGDPGGLGGPYPLSCVSYPGTAIIDLTSEGWCLYPDFSGNSVTSIVYSGSCCSPLSPTPTPTPTQTPS